MDFNEFLRSNASGELSREGTADNVTGPVDLDRAAAIEVNKDLYLEAEGRGMTLSELLETDEYDPSPGGSPLDAFQRQLALAGVRLGGKNPSTVEQFYQQAPALLPEFMLREIRRGQAMRPELGRLVANSTTIASNSYTPFFINTEDKAKLSLRPVGEGAEVPQLLVTEQNHAVKVADYGLALKTSYKALRYRTSTQFRVLLWYVGFRIQTDKIGMVVDRLLNGDGNDNAAAVINANQSGSLTYAILTLDEFKDPMAGYRFGKTGDLFSPLGATMVRSDEVPSDSIIGLDSRFAVEEVITQPLMIEYDKIIEQRFEEAVISESVTYARVLKEAAVVLDTVYS